MIAFFRERLLIKGPSLYSFVQGGTDSLNSDKKFQKEPALSLALRYQYNFLEK